MTLTLGDRFSRSGLAVTLPAGLLLLLLLCMPQSGWAASEAKNCTPEPTTNMAIGYGTVLSGADCTIALVADLDSFAFTAAANDTIRLLALKVGGGYYAGVCVEVRDPDGITVVPQVCGSRPEVNQKLPAKTGTYKIIVTEQGNDDVVNYNLSLTRMLPFQAGPATIKYGQVLSDEINPGTDVDYFAYSGTLGDSIRINATKTGGGYYAGVCFEVYQPDGSMLGTKKCGSVPLMDISLAQTGVHRIFVSEDGNDDVVTYNLGVQCLSGPCKVVQSCTLKDVPTYDAANKRLTMTFTAGATFAATWNGWLSIGNTMEPLFSEAFPITDPATTIIKTRENLSKSGTVGVLSTLTTATGGIVCSSWAPINTGRPGTVAIQEDVIEEANP